MTNEEKIKKYRCGICYCQDKHCEAIFNARVLFDDTEYPKNMLDEPPLLPCGHKLHSIILGASVIRDGREAEDRVRVLERKIERMEDGYEPWEEEEEEDD